MSAAPHAHVRRFGAGPQDALALHCTLAHSGAWRVLGAALADCLTLRAMDLPGHGQSADFDPAHDLHDQCTAAALRQLDAPMHVIGHSFGATVALRLAVERPDLLRSLTLIEPVFFAAALADAPDRMAAHEREAQPYFDALAAGDHRLAARLFNRFWGDGTRWDDMPASTQDYLAKRVHLVPAQASGIIKDHPGLMAPGALDRVVMPTLLIEGDRTADIIDAVHTSLARRLPDARRVRIPGAGHMAPLTHPGQVAREIRSLVEMAEE
ncbi:alpha/beta hydrolase [uncultured Roseobacter sp.]|uniref:alpha/beta fold hydrolase n=1 Tax=uncultured Roseobacter sp. TaxID=114847 RepID=UPI00260483F2|nr:alpha/beta hydrolase [uncultured Roseobacter sp.]